MNMTKSVKSSTLEKGIYGIGNIGANLCWTFMSMYVTMYYTDSVGISAAVAGTIMLVARLFDGVSDILCAMLIEKIRLPLGKIRPWFMISAPLLGIGLFLSFHVPADWNAQSKAIYVFTTYTFTAAVSYTIYNLAFSSILPLVTKDSNDRNVTAVTGTFITRVGIMIMNYVTPVLLASWGGGNSPEAWGKLTTLYAVCCTVMVFLMGVFLKEKQQLAAENTAENAEKQKAKGGRDGFWQLFKGVLTTKYTWLLFGVFLLFYLYQGMGGIRVYFFKDVLGDFQLYGTVSMLSSIPGLLAMLFVPLLFKKIGKKHVVIGGMAVYVLSCIILVIFPRYVATAVVCNVLMSLSLTPFISIFYVFIADLIDYIYKTKKIRAESITSMTSSLGTKVGSGLGSAIVGWGLALVGYNGTAAVQSAVTQRGIIILTAGVPALLMALIIIILTAFWKMDKEKEQLKEDGESYEKQRQ